MYLYEEYKYIAILFYVIVNDCESELLRRIIKHIEFTTRLLDNIRSQW